MILIQNLIDTSVSLEKNAGQMIETLYAVH